MMFKWILILLVALVFEAVGVVYLSKGLKEVNLRMPNGAGEAMGMVRAAMTNRNIVLGVFFEALFFGGLLILMSRGDVSFIWPLTSLGFGLTTLAARFVLHEEVSWVRWAGVACIIFGAGLITYSEKVKEPGAVSPPAPAREAR